MPISWSFRYLIYETVLMSLSMKQFVDWKMFCNKTCFYYDLWDGWFMRSWHYWILSLVDITNDKQLTIDRPWFWHWSLVSCIWLHLKSFSLKKVMNENINHGCKLKNSSVTLTSLTPIFASSGWTPVNFPTIVQYWRTLFKLCPIGASSYFLASKDLSTANFILRINVN